MLFSFPALIFSFLYRVYIYIVRSIHLGDLHSRTSYVRLMSILFLTFHYCRREGARNTHFTCALFNLAVGRGKAGPHVGHRQVAGTCQGHLRHRRGSGPHDPNRVRAAFQEGDQPMETPNRRVRDRQTDRHDVTKYRIVSYRFVSYRDVEWMQSGTERDVGTGDPTNLVCQSIVDMMRE